MKGNGLRAMDQRHISQVINPRMDTFISKNEGAYQNEDEKLEYKMSEFPRNIAH